MKSEKPTAIEVAVMRNFGPERKHFTKEQLEEWTDHLGRIPAGSMIELPMGYARELIKKKIVSFDVALD